MLFENWKFPHNKVVERSNVDANNYFIKVLKHILNVVGINVIDPAFKWTPQLVFTVIMAVTLVISFIFMIFSDVPISNKLEALCLFGAVYQGIHKLFTAILFPYEYYLLFKELRELHLKYLHDTVIGPVLKQICYYSSVLFEIFALSFYGVALAYMALPMIVWKKYGILTTIFPMQLPFIDWHTTFGYTINIIDHLFFLTIGITGLMAADVIFAYFVLHSIGYLAILKCRIDNLDKILLDSSKSRNFLEIQENLYDCIKAHQDYISYIEKVDASFSLWCMAQLATSELLLSLSILLTLWRQWIVGPFIAIAGLCQLLQYGILGTVVTYQNDKASDIIYGMSWYLLPVEHQKLVVLMILRAQHPAELHVGSFAKLNVATCMQVLKTTYSYVMMMLEFLS